MLVRGSIDLAKRLAGEENVTRTELAVEICVWLTLFEVDCKFAERLDDPIIAANGASCQRFRARPDESILLILDTKDDWERPT